MNAKNIKYKLIGNNSLWHNTNSFLSRLDIAPLTETHKTLPCPQMSKPDVQQINVRLNRKWQFSSRMWNRSFTTASCSEHFIHQQIEASRQSHPFSCCRLNSRNPKQRKKKKKKKAFYSFKQEPIHQSRSDKDMSTLTHWLIFLWSIKKGKHDYL